MTLSLRPHRYLKGAYGPRSLQMMGEQRSRSRKQQVILVLAGA